MDSFVKPKSLSREFSFTVEIESKHSECLFVEALKGEKRPTGCVTKRKAINDYVQNVQNQILLCKREQRLDFLISHVFNTRNHIDSVDKVFSESKSSSYDQVSYSDLTLKFHKFVLLRQTK
jgi:hypothetical protein